MGIFQVTFPVKTFKSVSVSVRHIPRYNSSPNISEVQV